MWIAPQAPAHAQDPTPLSGIEVVAPHGVPKVIASYPAPGAAVAPGVLVLMLRFDHRMSPAAWNYGAPASLPGCLEKPRLLKDERTFVLLCTAGFEQRFSLSINGDGKGFTDLASTPAEPYTLAFSTTGAEPVPSVADALKAAGLAEVDSPILTDAPAAPARQ